MKDEIVYRYVRGQGWVAGYVGAPAPDYRILANEELEDMVQRIRLAMNQVYVPMPRWVFEGV